MPSATVPGNVEPGNLLEMCQISFAMPSYPI